MEKARYNTELYSNLRAPLNNVKPSNFWGSHQKGQLLLVLRVDNMPEDDFIHQNRSFRGESGEKLEIKWGEMVTEL